MKTTNILVLILLVTLMVTGCKSNKNSELPDASSEKITIKEPNVANTADWAGSYFGVIPCASCPGINTLITLNDDGTYEKTVEYLESDDSPETTKGTFFWNDDNSKITLGETSYLVKDGKLVMLDKDGKIVSGELSENYELPKTELQLQPDDSEGYTLQQFIGNDKIEYNIIFNTNPKIPTAFVQTKDFKQMLSQTQVWAKGAEYEASNTKLIAKGNTATLLIGNKQIELKQK